EMHSFVTVITDERSASSTFGVVGQSSPVIGGWAATTRWSPAELALPTGGPVWRGSFLRPTVAFGAKRTCIGPWLRLPRSQMTQSGHERIAFAAMQGPDLLYLTRDPWPWGKPHEAAGIHRTSRQRCSRMADCAARAAGAEAGDRISWRANARAVREPIARVPPGPRRIRLQRRPQCLGRISLGTRPG